MSQTVRRCSLDRIRLKQFFLLLIFTKYGHLCLVVGFQNCVSIFIRRVQSCGGPGSVLFLSIHYEWVDGMVCVAFIRRPTNRPGHVFLVFVFLFSFASFFLAMCPKKISRGMASVDSSLRFALCPVSLPGRPPSAPADFSSVRVCSA
ncbi:hypothetical protein BDV36DRAFT_102545 [Aspergillus pseudocaelatus]|uniref:Transmembrane protein n=1 Tax=Aspergillus pseudocaelatus TaxID=1825620 RepID=A0ABQ6W1J0_9EURO|nr:hypothetical protein BDV36DRAFT_102545 [Aspergillus pseudocaelatus]